MKNIALRNILISLVFFAYSCSADFDPPGKLGDEPRIMAMVASPPEGQTGEHVTLTLHLYDPSGALKTRWLRCIPFPGQPVTLCPSTYMDFLGMQTPPPCSPDMLAPCVVRDSGDASDSGRSVDTELPPVPEDNGRYTVYYYALSTAASDPVAACTGFLSSPPVPDPGCMVGVKRVIVTDGPSNYNPVIWSILIDSVPSGDSSRLLPGRYSVSPALLAGSLDELGPKEPVFYPVEWFTDCGKMSSYRQDMKCYYNDSGAVQCDFDAPKLEIPETDDASGERTCRLDAVMWDNLGGVDIKEVLIRVVARK